MLEISNSVANALEEELGWFTVQAGDLLDGEEGYCRECQKTYVGPISGGSEIAGHYVLISPDRFLQPGTLIRARVNVDEDTTAEINLMRTTTGLWVDQNGNLRECIEVINVIASPDGKIINRLLCDLN